MKPAFVIEIVTPKGLKLDGLWLGPKKAKRVIIFVHGLTSNAFNTRLASAWVDAQTAVITFNNRGHDVMAGIKKMRPGKKGYRRVPGGVAHEVFTECIDDIAGAVRFARRAGAKEIYLAGHSTGCQKSVYYAYKKRGSGVKGIILLAPVSDYAAALHMPGKSKIAHVTKAARALVARGKKHDLLLLPPGLWHEVLDAQRFLSLYTPDSTEEIFSYSQPQKVPRVFKSVRVPLLVVWAGKDEFGSLAAPKTIAWFEKWNHSKKFKAVVVPGALHGFQGDEKQIARIVRTWMS
jgi:pimeloyl-ACP methyl ester carboxylesterase